MPFNPIGEPDLLLHLYKAIVRPVYEYSAIANVNAALCHQLKLQQQQNSVIRSILNLPKYTSADILHDASGLPKLHEHSICFAKKRLFAMKKSSPLIQKTIDQFQTISNVAAHKSPLEFILA